MCLGPILSSVNILGAISYQYLLYLLKTNKSPTCTDARKYLLWESSSFSEDHKQETIQIKQNNQTNSLLKT